MRDDDDVNDVVKDDDDDSDVDHDDNDKNELFRISLQIRH